MKASSIRFFTFAAAAVLAAGITLTCPAAEETAADAANSTQDISSDGSLPDEAATIGTFTGENDTVISLTNSTGKDISGISYRLAGEKKYGENLLTDGDLLADGETRPLAVSLEDETENEQEASYELKITFTDDKSLQLHAFPFDDAKAVEILLKGRLAYIRYESLSTKEEVNTLADEKAFREAKNNEKSDDAEETSAQPDTAEYAQETADPSHQEESGYIPDNAAHDYAGEAEDNLSYQEEPAYYEEDASDEPAYYYEEDDEEEYTFLTADETGEEGEDDPDDECLNGGLLN
ncbi:MAG: hypothetical protein IJ899_16350 [Blautia sp.]|nr:hypothetical protein [Blautia sp.]